LVLASLVSGANIVTQRRHEAGVLVADDGWQPAPPGACRSPCPALNTLANHGLVIQRDGKNLDYDTLKKALIDVLGLSSAFGTLFAHAATKKFADPATGKFDLCKLLTNLHATVPLSGPAGIEHSASMSREDRPTFDHKDDDSQRKPNPNQVSIVLGASTDGKMITVTDFAHARERIWAKSYAKNAAIKTDKQHFAEDLIATVEGCLFLGALSGNSNAGKFQISKNYAQSFLLNERLPAGWSKSAHALGIPELISCVLQQKLAWAVDEFTVITQVSKYWFGLMF